MPADYTLPLTSNTGFALLYTDRMWVMPFLDRLSLFSASVEKRGMDHTRFLSLNFNPPPPYLVPPTYSHSVFMFKFPFIGQYLSVFYPVF